MKGKSLFRMLALAASIVVLVLALAPASFAGGDDGDDQPRTRTHSSGGGGDTGSASGGAETRIGGMVANTNGSMTLPFALASGGLVVLTVAGGLASRRRVFE
jgi:hypothetical protein